MIKKINTADIDKSMFNWIFNRDEGFSIYPPLAWKYENKYYQLNYFNFTKDTFFILDSDVTQVLQTSINFYNSATINFIELANIYALTKSFKIEISDISVFLSKGIKGRKHFEILQDILSIPDDIKYYISEKNVSLKIIGIYLKLNDKLKNIVSEYIKVENPSVGSFRKFINFLFDNSRVIEAGHYDVQYFKSFTPASNLLKNEFEEAFKELSLSFKDITISNNDNFETDTLLLHFNINSLDDFKEKLKVLVDNEPTIKSIFDLMSKYDLH